MAFLQSRFTDMGMARDIDPAKASARYAWENYNIRITARDHDTLLAVTNERGNVVARIWERLHGVDEGTGAWVWEVDGEGNRVFSADPVSLAGTVIGYNVLNNYVTVFTKEEGGDDHIYRIEYVRGDGHEWQQVELYSGDLGFSVENPIETIGDYESEDVQKVYWLDGVNQPRFVNISDRYLTEYGIGDNTKFDFVASFGPTMTVDVEKRYDGAGLFSGGTVQYVFTYSNKYGQQSNIVYVTAVYYASPSGRGADPEETVNCQFALTVGNMDTSWQYVNIYRIMQTSESGQWVADKVAQVSTAKESTFTYVDDGSSTESADPASLLYVGGREISAYTFCAKDQTLFLGNIRLLTTESDPEIKAMFDNDRDPDGRSGLLSFAMTGYEDGNGFVEAPDSKYSIPYGESTGYYPYVCQLDRSSEQIRTFKAGEKYRIGIRFITNTGSRSAVYWVGDVDQTLYPEIRLDLGYVRKAYLRCTLTGDISQTLKNKGYVQAELMMAERTVSDRSVQAQGIIVPTVFNLDKRIGDAPFALGSWYARPRSGMKNPSRIVNRHFDAIPKNDSSLAEIQCICKDATAYGDTANVSNDYLYKVWILRCKKKSSSSRIHAWLYEYNVSLDTDGNYMLSDSVSTWDDKVASSNTTKLAKEIVSKLKEWGFTGILQDNIHDFLSYFKVFGSAISWIADASCYYATWVKYGMTSAMPKEVPDAETLVRYCSVPIGSLMSDAGKRYAATCMNNFFVDENVCTFHTPELYEGTDGVFDNANYKLRIVGAAKIGSNITDYSIEVENFADSSNGQTELSLSNPYHSDDPTGLLTFPFFQGRVFNEMTDSSDTDYKAKTDLQTSGIWIYPWHKTGSLTNRRENDTDENTGSLAEIAELGEWQDVLKTKTEGNLRFSLVTRYLWSNIVSENESDTDRPWEPSGGIYPVRVYNSDEDTLKQIKTCFDEKTYQGNYDILLSCRQMNQYTVDNDTAKLVYEFDTDDGYRVYDTGDLDTRSIYSDIIASMDQDEDNNLDKGRLYKKDTLGRFYDPVDITVKSTEHLVVAFRNNDDGGIVFLPNIYSNEIDPDTGELGEDDVVTTPQKEDGEEGQYYLPWDYTISGAGSDDLPVYPLSLCFASDGTVTYYFAGVSYDEASGGIELHMTKDEWDALYELNEGFGGQRAFVVHADTELRRFDVMLGKYDGDELEYIFGVSQLPMPWNVVTTVPQTVAEGDSLVLEISFSLPEEASGAEIEVTGAVADVSFEGTSAVVTISEVAEGEYTVRIKSLAGNETYYSDSEWLECAVFSVEAVPDEDVYAVTVDSEGHGEEKETPDLSIVIHGTLADEDCVLSGNMWQFTYHVEDKTLEAWSISGFKFSDKDRLVASEDDLDDPYFFIAELYTDYSEGEDSRYCGISDYAVQGNTFIPLGNVTAITGNEQTLTAYAGDTYFQRWDCQKTCKYSDSSENNINEFVSFMLETYRNLEGRYDIRRGLLDNQATTPENSNLFNGAYNNLGTLFNSYVLDGKYSLNEYPCQITWTLEKSLTEEIDTWANVTLSSTLDMDGDKGQVRALRRLSNSIVSFQDRGIAEVLFNTRTLLSTEQGVPVEIANSGRVEGKRYMSERNGCLNKWSIAQTRSAVWFVDNIAKSVCRIGQSVEDVSTSKGFGEWIRNNNSTELWNPKDFGNFVSYCDTVHNDVYFIGAGAKPQDTLCFSETLNEFASFYDYGPVTGMANVADRYVAFRSVDGGATTDMWLQGEGLYDHIFGEYQDYGVVYRIAPDPYGDKTFTNLEYRADMFDMDEPNPYMEGEGKITGNTFDTLEVWDEYQGNSVRLAYDAFKDTYADRRKKFRIWRTDIPRARKGDDNPFGLNRIRNPWIWLKLNKDTSGYEEGHNEMMVFHDLAVKYIE